MVDKEDSVFRKRKKTDQWLIRERSVKLVSLHVEYRHHTEMISGEWFQSEWDSSLEVDPDLMKDVVAIVEDEQVVDLRIERDRNVVGEPEGGIVFSLFKKDDCLPADSYLFCKIFLSQGKPGAVLFNPCLHFQVLRTS